MTDNFFRNLSARQGFFGPCFQVHLLNLSSTFIEFDVFGHSVTVNGVHRNLFTLIGFNKKGESSRNADWSEIL